MTDKRCADCDTPIEVGWTPGDGPVTCRECYEARGGPERARRRHRRLAYTHPDDRDPLNEYTAHDAARSRMRVVEGRRVNRREVRL